MVSTLDESEHEYAVRMTKKAILAHIATTAALKGISNADLQELLDLDRTHVSQLLNSKDDRFSLHHLVRICRKMGFGIDLHFYAIDPTDA